MTRLSWLSTRSASSLDSHTTLSAPTRSPYSEKLLEKLVETKKTYIGCYDWFSGLLVDCGYDMSLRGLSPDEGSDGGQRKSAASGIDRRSHGYECRRFRQLCHDACRRPGAFAPSAVISGNR